MRRCFSTTRRRLASQAIDQLGARESNVQVDHAPGPSDIAASHRPPHEDAASGILPSASNRRVRASTMRCQDRCKCRPFTDPVRRSPLNGNHRSENSQASPWSVRPWIENRRSTSRRDRHPTPEGAGGAAAGKRSESWGG